MKNGVVLSFMLFASLYSGGEHRKKMTIFYCKGGYGHQAVSEVLEDSLSDKYEINRVNVFDILSGVDPIKTLSFGKYTGESFYNYCIRKRWIRLTNIFSRIASKIAIMKHRSVEKHLKMFLDKDKPDMIVSVMPVINYSLLRVAKEKQLPFTIVTNDLDTKNYLIGIKKPQYEKFKYLLTFDDSLIRDKIKRSKLKANQVECFGFPVRKEFFEQKNHKKIKMRFNLPDNKKIVTILMGGIGSSGCYKYAYQLSKMDLPMHLVICIGKNEKLRSKINKIKFPKNIGVTILGFTKRISDIMAVSEILITKPGPNSISEAMCMNLPMILDNTGETVFWERMNIDFIKKHRLGVTINRYSQIRSIVNELFKNKSLYCDMKKNLQSFQKDNFGKSIKCFFDNES